MSRPSIFEAAGGSRAFDALTVRFYEKAKADPLLSAVFATDDVDRELHRARIRVVPTRRHARLLAVRNAPSGVLTREQSRPLMVMMIPSLRAFFQGRYRVAERSSTVPGAYHANFGFSMKRLALYDDELLTQANRGACGTRTWARGREEDVSSTGCLWVVPISTCPQEFDLVKVDGDQLFLGERPAGQDLCREDRRARALRSLPLVRRVRSADPRDR